MYRFVEPVLLMLLKQKGEAHGYDLGNDLERHAITDGLIERAALYRTLRALEANGNVVSEWQADPAGRARRRYRLTPSGEQHLRDWVSVLGSLAQSMTRFTAEARHALAPGVAPSPAIARARSRAAGGSL